MKFWELVSSFRDCPEILTVVLQDERWTEFRPLVDNYKAFVVSQDRQVLDQVVPEELVVEALKRYPYRFEIVNGFLRFTDKTASSLSALEVAERYDGSIIEDVREFGLSPIS